MIDDPASDDEFMFASDFYARKFGGQRTGVCTALLRAGSTITVDDAWRGNPEAGVAGVLRRQGHKVYHTENTLWHCLFGLLFWDELFETGQLHSGFDWMPQCLKNKTFMRAFGPEIEGKLAAVQSRTALPPILRSVAAHWAKPNGIFAWDHVDMDALRALFHACPCGVAAMLRLMGEDYQAMRDGFPDLMTEMDEAVSFVEVKAEGDVIRRNQLTRLRQLNNAGIRGRNCPRRIPVRPGAGLRCRRYRDDRQLVERRPYYGDRRCKNPQSRSRRRMAFAHQSPTRDPGQHHPVDGNQF